MVNTMVGNMQVNGIHYLMVDTKEYGRVRSTASYQANTIAICSDDKDWGYFGQAIQYQGHNLERRKTLAYWSKWMSSKDYCCTK